MNLLVTVTVLYLATSSVYSLRKTPHSIRKFPQYPPEVHCKCPMIRCMKEFCPRPGFCAAGTVKDCGCCDVCAKVEGEKCECSANCARGLKCKRNPLNPREWGTCQLEGTKVKGELCEETAECAQGLLCEFWGYRRFGKCVTQRKLQGERCEKTAECAQGLVCKSDDTWWSKSVRICSTEHPSSCSFAGKVLKDGESHTAKPIGKARWPGCIKCTCRDGTCEYDSDAECPGQKKKKESCTSNSGEVVQHGDSYTYKGGCRECVCNDGWASCRDTGRCEEEEMIDRNCYHNGKEIKHGQSFKWDCNNCYCYYGQYTCTKVACWPNRYWPEFHPALTPGQ